MNREQSLGELLFWAICCSLMVGIGALGLYLSARSGVLMAPAGFGETSSYPIQSKGLFFYVQIIGVTAILLGFGLYALWLWRQVLFRAWKDPESSRPE